MNRTTIWIIIILLFIGGIFYNCKSGLIYNVSPGNLEYVKQHAEARWSELGFRVIGYDGFNWGDCWFGVYGGAKVWYVLQRNLQTQFGTFFNNGITYCGYLQRWGDEIHMYELKAIDAIKP